MTPRTEFRCDPADHIPSDAELRIEHMLAVVNDPNPRAHCRLSQRDASLVLMVRGVAAVAMLRMGARVALDLRGGV